MKLEDALVGRKVLDVMMNPECTFVRFITDQGDLDYFCFADCCSESWINHVNSLDELIGGTVKSVDAVDLYTALGVEPEPTRQECDDVLTYRIFTEKGVCSMEFRNSSNGYYGGSLDYVRAEEASGFVDLMNELAFIKEDF